MKFSSALVVALLASISLAAAAEAVTLTYSDKTQRVAPYFEFRGSQDLPFNLNINGSVGFAPDLSSFITPFPHSASTGNVLSDQINNWARWDNLVDANLNLGYRFQLFDVNALIGQVNGHLMPYAGYRQLWTNTGALNGDQLSTQAGALHYGARFTLGLPLGFSGFAYGEASSLLSGSVSRNGMSEALATNGVTLPGYGVGVNWNFPFLNLASVYAGYRGFFLPEDLRLGNSLNGQLTLVHGVSLGASVLWFGI
ncbi:MAG: hypothetical protein ACO1RX_19725 [Candidatus Sericytochromatia bacterium]